jgi:branched-chain amino acid transport system ATP-binding protein
MMLQADDRVRRGPPAGPLLRVDDVAVQYGGVRALEPISLSLGDGDLILVLGQNGAGKSSLLRAIAGAAPTRSGSVVLQDRDISRVPAFRRVKRGIALVPEGRGRLPTLTVRDNLVLGWNASAPERRFEFEVGLDRIFTLFPILKERLEQDCATLSGGEMQMLAIGRALLTNPLVLLLDEPSLGLAPKTIARVYEVLAQLNAEGLAMIVVEQKAVPLQARRETAIVLHGGRVRFREDRRPTTRELAALYLGEGAMT